jgi:hypothetical protein
MADIRITTQAALRDSFWNNCGSRISNYYIEGRSQNDYPGEVRSAFVDYVDMLSKDGDISAALADRVTL